MRFAMTRVNADVDPDDVPSNPSDNTALADVLKARLSRRSMLKGGTVVAAAGFMTSALGAAAAPKAKAAEALLGFTAVPTSNADAVIVPAGYSTQVLIPWGTPIKSDGPAFKKDGSNTAAEQ